MDKARELKIREIIQAIDDDRDRIARENGIYPAPTPFEYRDIDMAPQTPTVILKSRSYA